MDLLLDVLVAVCAALVLPLGARLLSLPAQAPFGTWLAAGALAAVAALLDPGAPALVLALPLAALGAATALLGAARLPEVVRTRAPRPVAALSAAGSLGVVTLALVVDRSGSAPFLGFDATVWRLTVLHFCVAGFAASLLVGHTAVAAPGPLADAACWAVPLGTATVGAGWFADEWVELVGAVVLVAGLLAAAWVLLRDVVRWSDASGQLLAAAALVTPLSAALAVWWALGEAAGLPHPTLTWTAATHGVGNALGVGLAGLLGWTALAKEQL
jgi:hypothetical protein